jgi:xanthine dehydrogenase accessory factor
MREHRQIVERWHSGSGLILVTLIHVHGSSYRQPGARLMVCKDATYEGGISAGCLEADLMRKAAWLTRSGPAMERYSTLFDETAEVPFGLGCGGILDVLLEPVHTPDSEALLHALESALQGEEHSVATWLPRDGQPMRRAIFKSDGKLAYASRELSEDAIAQAWAACSSETTPEIDGLFLERLVPPQRLFIFGAGDDARPLVTMACLLGWSVTVCDGRAHLARKSRFPETNVEVQSTAESVVREMHARDAVVIMSHSYEQDRTSLVSALPVRPRYLGLLGSRQRSSLLIAEAAAQLGMSVAECCDLICAPVGLDLGGEGPEAIALAILAEAQARCMGKGNAPRRLSAERVQQYLSAADVPQYMQTQCGLDTV